MFQVIVVRKAQHDWSELDGRFVRFARPTDVVHMLTTGCALLTHHEACTVKSKQMNPAHCAIREARPL